MAQAIAEGCRSVSGIEVDVSYYLPPEQLVGFDAILVGSPTYHHDMPGTIKSYFEEAAVKNVNLKDKVGCSFRFLRMEWRSSEIRHRDFEEQVWNERH